MIDARIIFFGTPEMARGVLSELLRAGIVPDMVITTPDEPKGRGLTLTPPPVKTLAEEKGIPVFQPERIDESAIETIRSEKPNLFIVAAYGKLLPDALLAIPKFGTLNIHPSLLPKYRGASPVRDAILSGDTETGVTIMLLDKEMDHGPIVAQEKVGIVDVPKARELEERLFRIGAELLVRILPDFIRGKITSVPQEHDKATFTRKWTKEDGLIDVSGDPASTLRRIRACDGWPGAYFFLERNGKRMRVNVVDAHIEGETLLIDRVVPEGKKEMSYADFVRGAQH